MMVSRERAAGHGPCALCGHTFLKHKTPGAECVQVVGRDSQGFERYCECNRYEDGSVLAAAMSNRDARFVGRRDKRFPSQGALLTCTQCGGRLEFEEVSADAALPTFWCVVCRARHYDSDCYVPVAVLNEKGGLDVYVRRDAENVRAYPMAKRGGERS